jgi:hypothetical protein
MRLFLHLVCRTIDKQIILGDVSLSQLHNATAQRSFTPLNLNEVIQEGVVVGIDCEFVTLNQVTAASFPSWNIYPVLLQGEIYTGWLYLKVINNS